MDIPLIIGNLFIISFDAKICYCGLRHVGQVWSFRQWTIIRQASAKFIN